MTKITKVSESARRKMTMRKAAYDGAKTTIADRNAGLVMP